MRRATCLVTLITLLVTSAFLSMARTAPAAINDEKTDAPALPEAGDPAPPLQLRGLLQAPDNVDVSWDALADRVVVLEFWATWCGPCVAAIPHLNDIAEAMADEPVVFIAITDEEGEQVEVFLDRREMLAWIGLDDERQTFTAYGVRGRPTTVIVDGDGHIAAFTHPNELSEDVLRKIMAGKEPGIRTRRGGATGPQVTSPQAAQDDAEMPDPLLSVVIRPSRGAEVEGRWMTIEHNRMVLPHASLRTAVAMTTREMDSSRVLGADAITDDRFYIEVYAKDSRRLGEVESILRSAIEQTFSVRIEREPRDVDVFVLRVPDDGEHKLTESRKAPMAIVQGNRHEIYHASIENIAGHARAMLGEPWTPVIDETGLTGAYDFVLIQDKSLRDRPRKERVAEARRIMREKYGLVLEPAVRTLEMIVVRPADY